MINAAGKTKRAIRSINRAVVSWFFFAKVDVISTSISAVKTKIVEHRIKKSSRVRYDTLGNEAPTIKR